MSSDGVARDQLRAFIERIERMEEEKAAIGADIKEIYAEAKGNGFDTKILRKIVTIRKQDANERLEQEALLELYMAALGMIEAPDGDDDDDHMVDITPAPPQTILRRGTTPPNGQNGHSSAPLRAAAVTIPSVSTRMEQHDG